MPCIFSDKIPKEVCFSEKSRFLGFDKCPSEWADAILEYKGIKRSSTNTDILNSHYDIKAAHNILEAYYMKIGEII